MGSESRACVVVLLLPLYYCGPIVKPLHAHGLGFFILKMRQIVSKVLPSSDALSGLHSFCLCSVHLCHHVPFELRFDFSL